MKVTPAMMQAARRAEYDFFNRGRTVKDGRFIPTPDAVIRAMLEAVLSTLTPPPATSAEAEKKTNIVTARRPRPMR